MTDEVKRARDEQLMAALVVALTSGHAIESLDSTLRIERKPTGQFLVIVKIDEAGLLGERDDLFEDARSAVAYYLDLCDPH